MEKHILGKRYELINKIGGGGMAIVYKAKCLLLNRFVAVKILRPEFITDEDFVKRFRIEAQAAASLSHPNIVPIYDVGQEEDVYYIVMEYVDGVTLKDKIVEKKKLGWRESLNIAMQICSALDHAHRNKIVHRDIKPHNILITPEGIAKVTDFGIARAASAATLTLTGSTLGSVHYFSPEQARGGYIDEKSDIYSLGITIYEMLTGKMPFDGETPVGVALKHIQEMPDSPLSIDGDIPQAVNDIVVRAIQKEQSRRYQTASEMLDEMYMALRNPDSQLFIDDANDFVTKTMPALNGEMIQKGEAVGMGGKKSGKKPEKKRKDKLTVWLAMFTSAVIVTIMAYIGFSIVTIAGKGTEFKLPNFVGQDLNEVRRQYSSAQLRFRVINEIYSEEFPENYILSQKPSAGLPVKLPKEIEVEISMGQNIIEVPPLENIDWRDAEIQIRGLGLEPVFEEEYHDIKPEGIVTRTEPASGVPLKSGEAVTIFKSKGPDPSLTVVPDLRNKTLSEAKQLIIDANLVCVILEQQSNLPPGTIIGQSIEPETQVPRDTSIDIIVSRNDNTKVINLVLGPDYHPVGDSVKVTVKVYYSDTGMYEIQLDEYVKLTEFPKPVVITGRGRVHISVYLDNGDRPYLEQELVFPTGGR